MIEHSEKDGDLRTWQAQVADTVNAFWDGTNVTAPLRIDVDTDVSPTSTGHGLQVGGTSVANLAMDGNEVMARNNGNTSALYVNSEGGAVHVGLSSGGTGSFHVNGTRIWPWEDHATTTSTVHSSFDVTLHRVRSGAGMIYLRGVFTCTTAVAASITNLNLCTLTGAPASTDSISQGLTILEASAGGNVTPPLVLYNPSTRIIVLSRRPAMGVNDQYYFSGVLYCPQ